MRSILNALQEGRLFELREAGKERALEFLARILDANPDIEVGTDAIEAVKQREQECNTGIGLGVAVPHVRAKRDEGELFCAIGWSQPGIEYGAPDGMPVHLVFMYYIPGVQKNVYLKEVSILVKAIRKSGGIEPITDTDNLNVVRNLLLDWVTAGLGESGPEAVARMIKLEVKQAQGMPVPATVSTLEVPAIPVSAVAKVMTFSILTAPPNGAFVLAQDADWVTAMEKENGLSQRLAAGSPFTIAGRQVFVTAVAPYPGARVLYQCVAFAPAP
ncbi:MAG: PTS sugar transporter subunit IIA [Verrucomicrobia bacterium]|nr:PTS sugar transporter subunit IIA [Verrucomicrobiota bacterium]